jgi:hypothetical protein
MSHPIQDMKAGYEIDDSSFRLYTHDPQEIKTITLSNYAGSARVVFYFNSEVFDKHDTAVFHIKWKNQK